MKNPQDEKIHLVTRKRSRNCGVLTDARGPIGTDITPNRCRACIALLDKSK